jgi:serine/threonine protein kinase
MLELAPGTVLGAYVVTARIGRGGMASVYQAHHPALDRNVAIKVLWDSLAEQPGFLERFRREARSASRLRHPNILTVYDFGESNGTLYMVTELLPGGTLADRLGQPLSYTEVLRVLRGIGAALDVAHADGLIHRDVKPSNILFTRDGEPVLADFGIARLSEAKDSLTAEGTLIGTPHYMAPEMAAGEDAGPASDLYSLGVVLYEMLVGEPPFPRETSIAVVRAHIHEPPPSLLEHYPAMSPEIDAVVMRALAKQPTHRYRSGAALAAAFEEAFLTDDRPTPRPNGAPTLGAVPGTPAWPEPGTRADRSSPRPTSPPPADVPYRSQPSDPHAGWPSTPQPRAPTAQIRRGQDEYPVPQDDEYGAVRPGPPAPYVAAPGAQTERWRGQPQARPQEGGTPRGLILAIVVAVLVGVGVFLARSAGLLDGLGITELSSATRTPTVATSLTPTPPPVTPPAAVSPTVPGAASSPSPTLLPGGGSPIASPPASPPPALEVLPSITPAPSPSAVPTPTVEPVAPTPTADPRRGPLAVQFLTPVDGASVPARPVISGRRSGLQGPDQHLWMLIHPDGGPDNWWPYKRELIADRDGSFRIEDVEIGGATGTKHVLAIGVVDAAGNQAILKQIQEHQDEPFPGGQPPGFHELARVTVSKR